MNSLRRNARRAGAPVRLMLVASIKVYRFLFSGLAPRCRYYPSCSAYAEEALRTRGVVAGLVLSTWRVLRCNPFSRGGVDHVPARPPYDELIHSELRETSR